MVMLAVLMPTVQRFAISCEDRWFWSLECWLFGYMRTVVDWASFLTMATLMLFLCYRLMERVGDSQWLRAAAKRNLR